MIGLCMKAKHPNFPSPGVPECLRSSSIVTITYPSMPNTMNLLETRGLQANALVSELEEYFPPLNPNPTDTIEQVMYRAGQRSVVEWIINKMENE